MIDLSSKFENYINHRNRPVWEEIMYSYDFVLLYDPKEYSWKSRSENGIATIVTPTLEIDYESFTHELLHIYLDYKGLSTYEEVVNIIDGIDSFLLLTDNQLISWIYNFASHKKMFPYYQEMGFSEYKFVKSRIKFTFFDYLFIRLFLNIRRLKAKGVNQFIGHSLAIMNSVVLDDKPKCEKFLAKLKRLNPELFQIVLDFDKQWENSDDLNLASRISVFEKKLDNWLETEL